ncbi:glutamate--tRNA ligase [Sphingomicrobium astaxanthinifaciens]|uniref:glutamate--tRNA ligase n=1 Tax=Sphingomicrobium astaxanthinifaciens TaxID=1227949 RepID=UPI001FCC4B01|nr:glutamate--tRNA ligase [Sphingomicrobium astaxanthinifaciens]MCJ7421144.1 glutamate--tRNA ligase family protein [Sphingomicrobium astaxanthinifaciens]
MKTRFAPSPTGRLHVGNIRTALHNCLLARKAGGQFLLRLDDTDVERSRPEFADAIRHDLDRLGLTPDASFCQSDRIVRYAEVFDALQRAGRVYACYETPEELELRRKVLLGRGLPPIYERPEGENAPVEGVAPHWRFRLDHAAPIEWEDAVRGPQRFEPANLSDPVIRRADGSWLYLLPSVIDDADHAISHVVRGEDHVTNSAIQLQMFDAIGADRPTLAHTALIVSEEGKLSKRAGAEGLAALDDRGFEPMALLSVLARIGTSQPVEPAPDIAALAAGFDLASFGRAPARFAWDEVAIVNARLLHATDYADVVDRLPAAIDAARWQVLRGNLERLDETAGWAAVFDGEIEAPEPSEEDRAYLAAAGAVAAGLEWDEEAWGKLTTALKARTGRKGKALFLPLRRALTGRSAGPEMAALLPLIDKRRALARLGS